MSLRVIFIAAPIDGCTLHPGNYTNKIILIKRGGCTFTKKVFNAQSLGAAAVVVMDQHRNSSSWKIHMHDEDVVSRIIIPSVFVSHRTGLQLLLQMSQTNDTLHVSLDPAVEGFLFSAIFSHFTQLFGTFLFILIIPNLIFYGICYCFSYWQKGIRKRQVATMPTRRFDSSCDKNDECSICLEDLKHKDSLLVLPVCGHEFHVACISPWLTDSSLSCPLCRSPCTVPMPGRSAHFEILIFI